VTGRRLNLRRVAAIGVVALVVGIGVVSCGLPQDREPQKIASPLPENLRVRENSTTTGPTRTEQRTIYFVKTGDGAGSGDMLAPVVVDVTVPANPADLPGMILEELLKGPTTDEQNRDLSTEIPRKTELISAIQNDDTVTVNLHNLDVEGPGLKSSVTQILFTLTELPTIRQVRFLINSEARPIPLEGGSSEPGEAIGRGSFPKEEGALTGDTTTASEPASSPAAADQPTTTGSVLHRP